MVVDVSTTLTAYVTITSLNSINTRYYIIHSIDCIETIQHFTTFFDHKIQHLKYSGPLSTIIKPQQNMTKFSCSYNAITNTLISLSDLALSIVRIATQHTPSKQTILPGDQEKRSLSKYKFIIENPVSNTAFSFPSLGGKKNDAKLFELKSGHLFLSSFGFPSMKLT